MKKFMTILLLIFTSVSFGKNHDLAHVSCYSGSQIIFDNNVNEVFPGQGYIVAVNDGYQTVIIGDCVVSYQLSH